MQDRLKPGEMDTTLLAIKQKSLAIVNGQNSWKLRRVKIGVFEVYFGKSDKIDGNWV